MIVWFRNNCNKYSAVMFHFFVEENPMIIYVYDHRIFFCVFQYVSVVYYFTVLKFCPLYYSSDQNACMCDRFT